MVPLSDPLKQARARIFRGNTHRESELFILFEPLTQVIRKGKAGKPNEFGKMVNRRRWRTSSSSIMRSYLVRLRRPRDPPTFCVRIA